MPRSTADVAGVRRRNAVFPILCVAVALAVFGTETTGFGLGMWFYERTGSATVNGLLIAATMVPQILAAPFTGLVVDRWSPRTALVAGHVGAVTSSAALLTVLRSGGAGSLWLVLFVVAVQSGARAAEASCMSAAAATLIAPEDRGAANGLSQLAVGGPQFVAPLAAGALLPVIGLPGLVGCEISMLLVALILLSFVPRLSVDDGRRTNAVGWTLAHALVGWRFVWSDAGLTALGVLLAALNFNLGFITVLFTPLVLGFSGPRQLGFILSACGIGLIAGGVTMAAWGGPRRPIRGILTCAGLQTVTLVLLAWSRSIAVIALSGFLGMFVISLVAGSSEVIWQRKVPAAIRGRVFSVRAFVNGLTFISAFVVAGPLVDRVLEPNMVAAGPLGRTLGRWIGTGHGRGSAAAFLAAAVFTLFLTAGGFAAPRLRRVDDEVTTT